MNNNSSWNLIESGTSANFKILGTELDDIVSDYSSGGNYHWFRLDITEGTEALSELGGLSFYNSATSSTEYLYITDFFVIDWHSGVLGWNGKEPTNSPRTVEQANIAVCFTSVTVNGMTIQTSAPFTGTIRYLCSVQG